MLTERSPMLCIGDLGREVFTGRFEKTMVGLRIFFGPRTLWRSRGTRPEPKTVFADQIRSVTLSLQSPSPGYVELFSPSDGCANVFPTLKVEQALAAIGRSETFQRALLMLHDAQILVAGDANVKRACVSAPCQPPAHFRGESFSSHPATPACTLHFAYSARACSKSNLDASALPVDSYTKANPRRVFARSSSASSPCCR